MFKQCDLSITIIIAIIITIIITIIAIIIIIIIIIAIVSLVSIREYTQAGCTDTAGAVSANYLACGACVNYNDYITKAPLSVLYDCTGTTINGAGFNAAGCVGTPACTTITPQTCGAAPSLLQPQGSFIILVPYYLPLVLPACYDTPKYSIFLY